MSDLELMEHLNNIVGNTIREIFNEYGVKNKIKTNDMNAFKKTEQLLWNYDAFVNLIEVKKEQIAELQASGVPQKSKSITEFNPGGGYTGGFETPEEQADAVINHLMEDIKWIRAAIDKVDLAIATVKDDPDYPLVVRYYVEGERISDIAAEYGVEQPTISMRKNRLVRKMSMYLFPKEVIGELLD